MTKSNSSSVPIIFIAGFLGSGKTRFLSQLLKSEAYANSAVIINEFGEVGLDHLLIEYTRDRIFNLPNGCLCCSAHGELVDKIFDLTQQRNSGKLEFDRIIIETSGVADPTNLMQTLWQNPAISTQFNLQKIITLIGLSDWQDKRSDFGEKFNHLAISDAVIVSKADLLPVPVRDEKLAHLISKIEHLIPSANIHILPLKTTELEAMIVDTNARVRFNVPQHHIAHNVQKYKSLTISHNTPIETTIIYRFMDRLLYQYSENLLRMKGLVLTTDQPTQPLLVQAVNNVQSPFEWLDNWQHQPHTRITVIHTNDIGRKVENLFNSMLSIPEIDQPDRLAIDNNPLSIPGIGDINSQH